MHISYFYASSWLFVYSCSQPSWMSYVSGHVRSTFVVAMNSRPQSFQDEHGKSQSCCMGLGAATRFQAPYMC